MLAVEAKSPGDNGDVEVVDEEDEEDVELVGESDKPEEEVETDLSGTKWEEWLHEANQIAADSGWWGTADVFVERFEAVVSRKLAERDRGRQRLAEALAELNAEFGHQLTAHTWDAQLCAASEALALSATAEELLGAFREAEELKRQIGSAQMLASTEYLQLLTRSVELQPHINSLCSQLSQRLSPESDAIATPAEVEPEGVKIPPAEPPAEPPVVAQAGTKITVEQAAPPIIESVPQPLPPEPTPPPVEEPEPEQLEPPKPQPQPEPEPEDWDYPQLPPDPSLYIFGPNETSEEIAKSILEADQETDPRAMNSLTWRLVYDDQIDFAVAVANALPPAESNEDGRLPLWLIEALAIGPHILTDDGSLHKLLQERLKSFNPEELFKAGQKEWNQAVRLLMSSAAMRAALVAPNTGASGALSKLEFTGLPRLYAYCTRLAREAERAQSLDFETLRKVKEYVSWKQRLDSLRQEAADWLKNAPEEVRISYAPALWVWQHWLRKGLILNLLTAITDDRVADLDQIEQLLDRFATPKSIRLLVKKTARADLDKPYLGEFNFNDHSVDNLMEAIEEVRKLALTWVEIQKTRPHPSSGYLQRAAEELGTELLSYRDDVLTELNRFEAVTTSILIQSGIKHCRRALENTWRLFDPQHSLPETEVDPNLLLYGGLLKVPALTLDEDWSIEPRPGQDVIKEVLTVLASPEASWERSFFTNSDVKGDHLATKRIIEYLQIKPDPELDTGSLLSIREKNLRDWRDRLRQKVESTTTEVDRGYAYDWLGEDESDNYQKRIHGTRMSLDQILRFASKIAQVDGIQAELKEKSAKAQRQVRERFELLQLPADHPAYERLNRALQRNDFSTANEYIDILKEGGNLPDPENNIDFLQQFFPHVPREFRQPGTRSGTEILRKVRAKQNFNGLTFSDLSDDHIKQAAELAELWFGIRTRGIIVPAEVERLLRMLGFPGTPRSTMSSTFNKRWWVDARVGTIRDKKICPIPKYGSGARGYYRIFCVLDDPASGEVFEEMRETQQYSTIVLHFGWMSEQERIAIAAQCRSQQRTFIVIDSALILYLCTQPEKRLRALFDCTLPFTWLQPYVLSSGLVPFETFYGRKAEKRAITAPLGPCFIYGGKRLGKTALLNEVAAEFNRPAEGKIAIFIDLKEAGIGYQQPVDQLWRVIVERLQGKVADDDSELKELRIFPPSMTTRVTVETVQEHINRWLNEDHGRRILLLLDEADNFLEQDGEERTGKDKQEKAEFIRVHQLMKVWERTGGRFKVVYAGLHNVLRTTKVVNKVNPSLWHFGEAEDASRCIGPLIGKERDAGLSLIQRPFFSLGYRFDSSDLVLRIMSHTNWYPSLIQLYGYQLLEYLTETQTQASDPKSGPPYLITSRHIDIVYRKLLYEQLKERFSLTLKLDERYNIIAYSMAYRLLSMKSHDAAASLSVEEIQAEALKWWSEGFQKTGSMTEDAFRALLKEMDGLGIVRSEGEDQYTLRSLNIFSILGKETEIQKALTGEHKMPDPFDPSTFRAALSAPTTAPWKRSPLIAQQTRELEANKNEASIIFGTKASGLGDLSAFLAAPSGNKSYIKLENLNGLETFAENLKLRLARREPQGLTLIEVGSSCAWDYPWVEEAISQVSSLASATSWARVVFPADPEKSWQIINSHPTEFLSMKGKVWTSFTLTPWHDKTLTQWLEDFNFAVDETDAEFIKFMSGNWPLILAELPALDAAPANWKECLNRFVAKVDDTEYIKKLSEAFGLNVKEPCEVLKALVEYGSPLNAEDLAELSEDKSIDLVRRSLRWAELLMLVSQSANETWTLDPIVNKVLTLSSSL
jgi:hypothetical protein